MTKEEILEGNKLIAEFMGYKYYPITDVKDTYHAGWKINSTASQLSKIDTCGNLPGITAYLCRNHNCLRFYNSWDWLMTGYLKIKNNIDYGCQSFRISTTYIRVVRLDLKLGESTIKTYCYKDYDSELITLWVAVVEFITWFNSWNNLK